LAFVEDYLIALLKVAGEEKAEINATKIQKIFFLLEKEMGINLNLDFKPWLYGPYSEKLDEVLNSLIARGIVKVDEEGIVDPFTEFTIGYKRSFKLNGDYKVEISNEVLNFFKRWVAKDRKEILKYVYSKYKEYTDLSKIREEVLGQG